RAPPREPFPRASSRLPAAASWRRAALRPGRGQRAGARTRRGGASAQTSERKRRDARAGASPPRYFFGALTARRLRPFARRRFSTVRPCLVLIRLRNPCSRLRRILLGWYVRFTATASGRCEKSAAPKHAGCTVSRNGGARTAASRRPPPPPPLSGSARVAPARPG